MESLHSQVYQFGKLFQDCKAVVEELSRADRMNELQREATPLRLTDVPEVLEVQEVPLSEEVRIVPESPTAMKILFPKVIPSRSSEEPEVLEVHMIPSAEVKMVPD